jgi:hypothetical protein
MFKIIILVTFGRKYVSVSFVIRKIIIAVGVNDDFFILLNYFLCFIKSKLKNVWVVIRKANSINENIAIVICISEYCALHCLKGDKYKQLNRLI